LQMKAAHSWNVQGSLYKLLFKKTILLISAHNLLKNTFKISLFESSTQKWSYKNTNENIKPFLRVNGCISIYLYLALEVVWNLSIIICLLTSLLCIPVLMALLATGKENSQQGPQVIKSSHWR
jgi:hypothetical protein